MDKQLTRRSKKLSRLLRHRATAAGLTMDPAGWVAVADVLAHLAIDRAQLEEVVAKNNKRRLQLEGERIRCCQGHSTDGVPVSLDALEASWERWTESTSLWHGTYAGALEGIAADGIEPRGRTHVHLTASLESRVGKRANVDVALEIEPSAVRKRSTGIFRAPNGVILTRSVPRSAIVGVTPMTARARQDLRQLEAALGLG